MSFLTNDWNKTVFEIFLKFEDLLDVESTYKPIEYNRDCLDLFLANHKNSNKSLIENTNNKTWKKIKNYLHSALSSLELIKLKGKKIISPLDSKEILNNSLASTSVQNENNEIFYDVRKTNLQLKAQKKHLLWNTSAIIVAVLLATTASVSAIQPLSASRMSMDFESLISRLAVSDQKNDDLNKEVEKLKAKTKQRQDAIKTKGDEILKKINNNSSFSLEQALNALKDAVDEQNQDLDFYSTEVNISPELSKKLIDKMEEKKQKLLDTYKNDVSQALNSQVSQIKNTLEKSLTESDHFKNMTENQKTQVKTQLTRLQDKFSEGFNKFTTVLENDIKNASEDLKIAIENAEQTGLTADDLKTILDVANEEINSFVERKTKENLNTLFRDFQTGKDSIIHDLIYAATGKTTDDLTKHIKSLEHLNEDQKTTLLRHLDQMLKSESESGLFKPEHAVHTTVKTLENQKQQDEQSFEKAKIESTTINASVMDKTKESENNFVYDNPHYQWCNSGSWFRHVYTLGYCSGLTVTANIGSKIKGENVDWNGIFNVINAISMATDIVAATSGLGAVITVAKTALTVSTKHALKTVGVVIGKQALKTLTMTGAGSGIGIVSGLGVETGSIIGASLSVQSLSGKSIVAKALAKAASKKALAESTKQITKEGFKVAMMNGVKRAMKKTTEITLDVTKGITTTGTQVGAGAAAGAVVGLVTGESVEKSMIAGAALSGYMHKGIPKIPGYDKAKQFMGQTLNKGTGAAKVVTKNLQNSILEAITK